VIILGRRYADCHVPSLLKKALCLWRLVLLCHWRGNYDQRVEARYFSDADNERRLTRVYPQLATGCKLSDDIVAGNGMAAQG
jgi:hypothetical protein